MGDPSEYIGWGLPIKKHGKLFPALNVFRAIWMEGFLIQEIKSKVMSLIKTSFKIAP